MTDDDRQKLRREAVEWAENVENLGMYHPENGSRAHSGILAMESIIVEQEAEIEGLRKVEAERDYLIGQWKRAAGFAPRLPTKNIVIAKVTDD